jgi:glycerol-3-phosphate dehydrogenase
VRPLLAAPGGVGHASREHRVIEEGPLVTITGGKYTTFRVMARAALSHVARRLGRDASPIHDSTEALPEPVEPGAGVRAAAEFAVAHEFATTLEDVMRRRTLRWLAPDHGRAAAREVAEVMTERLGWSEARAREELQIYDAARWEEEALLRRADPEHA